MRCKYKPDISLYICFIVDPAYEGQRKKEQGIYEIKALTEFPEDWNDDNNLIACLCMRKGVFDEKLQVFIDEIVKKLHKLQDKQSLNNITDFLLKLDGLKSINRKTYINGGERVENLNYMVEQGWLRVD